MYTMQMTSLLLENTPTKAKFPLQSLEQPAGDIGLHVNADKMEYIYFKWEGDISSLKGGSLE